MVKKNTIGKVQIGIGIIILLLSIIGTIYSIDWGYSIQDNVQGSIDAPNFQYYLDQYGNESAIILSSIDINSIINISINSFIILGILLATSMISFFLSLLFITQGLVNMNENKITK